jgi:hypothetical protein
MRAAANDPNILSFTMDIRRYMSGPVRVTAAISEAASAVDDKVPLHGDGIAVGYSHGSPASSETGDVNAIASTDDAQVPLHSDGLAVGNSNGSPANCEIVHGNAIVSDVDAANAASAGSEIPICGNCKQREIDDVPKKCGHADWCSYCDEALWQTNAIAAEVANAVTRLQHRHSAKCERRQDSGSEICVNCKQREIDNVPKKCGFTDWCSYCDELLWQTNPAANVANASSTGSEILICGNCKEREIDDVPKKCGFTDWCSYCDESLWQTNPDVICLGDSALAIVAPSTCAPLSSLSLALPSEPASVAHTKRKRVQANCSSESDVCVPAPSKRKRNCVISSDDDVRNPYEGEAEEDSGAESDEDNGSDGDSEFDSDGGDDEHGDDAHTGRRRIAVSEACAALRNRRRFKASQNTCPLCADLRVVLSHLLGLE